MPRAGKRWYHVIFNTKGSWLHGDPRGFRSRDHRIHSSGDYNNPPPPEEHAGLHKYHKDRSGATVYISKAHRQIIGKHCRAFLQCRSHTVLAVAVGATHVHLLTELNEQYEDAKKLIGQLKNIVSYEVRDILPGSIWSRGCTLKPIHDQTHQDNTFNYRERSGRRCVDMDVSRERFGERLIERVVMNGAIDPGLTPGRRVVVCIPTCRGPCN